MKPTPEQVRDAIRVILSDRQSYRTSLNYAVNYALYALTCPDNELRNQVEYILCTIPKWQHPQDKDIRATLRAFVR